MRSGSLLVVVFSCTWSACLDTQPDKPGAARDAAFSAWDAGAGSEKPAAAQPVAARAANAEAGSGGQPRRSKPLQPSAAGARADSAQDQPRSGEHVSGSAGSAGTPAPEGPMLPLPERSGDLIITELMIDPKALSDAEGEWVELYNATASTLSLRDCELDDGGKSLHALAPTLHVEAGAYITIARGAAPGFKPDATLALSLTNSADSVAIVCRGIEIDRVRYDQAADFVIKPGVSLALDPGELAGAQHNDAASAWCEGRDAYSTDLGSPGRANPSCHGDSSEPGDGEAEDHDAGTDSAESD